MENQIFGQSPAPKKNGFLGWVLGIPPNPKPNPKNPKKNNTQPNTQTLKTQKTQYPSQHPTQIKWVFWVLKFRKTGFYTVHFNVKLFYFISNKI